MSSLTLRQITGIFRLELRSSLLGRRAWATYFLAFAPVGLMMLRLLLAQLREEPENFHQAPLIFGAIFHSYLRTSVFLASLILFMSLFRSEILRRSLHYYFLTPVRREVLVVGKYLAALFSSVLVFAIATPLLYLLMLAPWGLGNLSQHMFQGPGLTHLVAYTGVAVLACVGYGAVFLLVGLFLRNPVVGALLIWLWESINFILPALLKKASVIFYLRSLYPVPLPDEVFAIIADPISPWFSVPGLVLFTTAVLALAGWRARGMEINYGED